MEHQPNQPSQFSKDYLDFANLLAHLESGSAEMGKEMTGWIKYPEFTEVESLIIKPDPDVISKIGYLLERFESDEYKDEIEKLDSGRKNSLDDGIIRAKLYLSAFKK